MTPKFNYKINEIVWVYNHKLAREDSIRLGKIVVTVFNGYKHKDGKLVTNAGYNVITDGEAMLDVKQEHVHTDIQMLRRNLIKEFAMEIGYGSGVAFSPCCTDQEFYQRFTNARRVADAQKVQI